MILMTPTLQMILTAMIVIGAAAFLLFRLTQLRPKAKDNRASACGSCSGCPAGAKKKT